MRVLSLQPERDIRGMDLRAENRITVVAAHVSLSKYCNRGIGKNMQVDIQVINLIIFSS